MPLSIKYNQKRQKRSLKTKHVQKDAMEGRKHPPIAKHFGYNL